MHSGSLRPLSLAQAKDAAVLTQEAQLLCVVRCRSGSQAAPSSQPVRSQALKDENMGRAVPPVRGQAKREVSGGQSGTRVMPPVRGQATRQGPGGQAAARPLRAAPGETLCL